MIDTVMAILTTFSLMTIFCMSAGTYIWINNATHLLQNFSGSSILIKDKKGLSKWAGIFLNIMGLLLLLIGFMTWKYAATKYELVPIIISIPVMYLMIVVFLVRSQHFIK